MFSMSKLRDRQKGLLWTLLFFFIETKLLICTLNSIFEFLDISVYLETIPLDSIGLKNKLVKYVNTRYGLSTIIGEHVFGSKSTNSFLIKQAFALVLVKEFINLVFLKKEIWFLFAFSSEDIPYINSLSDKEDFMGMLLSEKYLTKSIYFFWKLLLFIYNF